MNLQPTELQSMRKILSSTLYLSCDSNRCLKVIELLQTCFERCKCNSRHCASVFSWIPRFEHFAWFLVRIFLKVILCGLLEFPHQWCHPTISNAYNESCYSQASVFRGKNE
ncbi:hypothetical protein MRB53_016911 [Persea americana]|uniref:Uncharacterized protein n=1 Tax=Persea americana TaxID=3435 RepID=A0ACC2M4X5_PERAE|nr:hypothetical protein MRB53_016911 [Persea americana]